ncbi:MAG: hypothetical protein IKL70_06425 [Oscillospiraceae bacterium]|nr:hypothetical protein [Oscillospiraceae bacterium]
MRTAIQVMIIIGMVFWFWTILPLIFGIIALNDISNGNRPSTAMSILVLLFCNAIAGILLLVAKDEDFIVPPKA